VIFGAIAVAWLAYLVPMFLNSRETVDDDVDVTERFDAVKIIRKDDDHDAIITTPFTRRADLYALHRTEVQAARRRATVLAVLLVVAGALFGVSFVAPVPMWAAAIPTGLAVAFLFVARFSVKAMRRMLDEQRDLILAGNEEHTVALDRDTGKVVDVTDDLSEHSVELGMPVGQPGSLWEPIPVTMPTYVSKPLAPRTVRTIDLSAPDVTSASRSQVPPVVDAPAQDDEGQQRRAVGE